MTTLNFDIPELHKKCRALRISILKSIFSSGKGHVGGAFSMVEIIVTLYYTRLLRFSASYPLHPQRDTFILSKGHAAIGLYAVLADLGFFPTSHLSQFNQNGLLSEHPDPRIPGIESVSGSLGHGLSLACGTALASKLDDSNQLSIVLMGDGECYEGSVWEAALFASHHNLSNLILIIDRNNLITNGSTEDINMLNPLASKWEAFGWHTTTVDGHCIEDLYRSIDKARNNHDAPSCIIANTIKGKGISFMENNPRWHHGSISESILKDSLHQLEQT